MKTISTPTWSAPFATVAWAHTGAHGPHDLLRSWTVEPLVLAILVLSAALYVAGERTVSRRRGPGRMPAGSSRRQRAFAVGLAAIVAALVSPVDAVGEMLFAAHMVQHLLLTMVAAPLLVMSDAGLILLRGLPRGARRAARRVLRSRVVRSLWRIVSHPLTAWSAHMTTLVVWHLPGPYQRAVLDDRIHALEHWSFLVTALLFWWAVLAPRPRGRLAFGAAVIYLFTAATGSGILGAMLSMSREAWYTVHAPWTTVWGLTPLEDQQLAGLIMWVPAAIIYLAALVPCVLRALSEGSTAQKAWG